MHVRDWSPTRPRRPRRRPPARPRRPTSAAASTASSTAPTISFGHGDYHGHPFSHGFSFSRFSHDNRADHINSRRFSHGDHPPMYAWSLQLRADRHRPTQADKAKTSLPACIKTRQGKRASYGMLSTCVSTGSTLPLWLLRFPFSSHSI